MIRMIPLLLLGLGWVEVLKQVARHPSLNSMSHGS
jgi:hypothetical protein